MDRRATSSCPPTAHCTARKRPAAISWPDRTQRRATEGRIIVSGSYSPRQSGPVNQIGRQAPAPDSVPDPWGVRRAENLLTSLEGILSARVVTTPLGEVSEVHVLAQAGLAPK